MNSMEIKKCQTQIRKQWSWSLGNWSR